MEDEIAQFTAITSSDPARAQQYLTLTDGNLEHAIQLFFDSGGVDMATTSAPIAGWPQTTRGMPSATTGPSRPTYHQDASGTVMIDSDDEDDGVAGLSGAGEDGSTSYEDDEAMARRLQQEAYGPGGVGDEDDQVRAPMARTTETLVGPGSGWTGVGNDEDDMRAAISEQMMARQRRAAARPGIFNQQASSVWDNGTVDAETHRRNLARATGGASEESSKSNLLAQLFRPPVDLIAAYSWDEARETGKEDEKWIMINIQDPSIFDCQVLNRDIWKHAMIRETIKEHFVFMQFTKDDPRSDQYVNYYFQNRDVGDAYPHIAIVDPRTGEQVKVWSGPPVPKAEEFLMEVHEFLDRYSLKAFAKNPVAIRKPATKAKDVDKMSEEEMLEMALKNSLANSAAGGISSHQTEDPDHLTRAAPGVAGEADKVDGGIAHVGGDVSGPFSLIPSDRPHTEPTDTATSTRIQFRWAAGRIVRRFALSDPVQRLYEWLKASPLEGKEDAEFELIAMGKNLIESLDETVEQAGLKNGTIMVEHLAN